MRRSEVGLCLIVWGLAGTVRFDCVLNVMGSHEKVLRKEKVRIDLYFEFTLASG